MRSLTILAALLATSSALAQTVAPARPGTTTVYINGTPIQGTVVTVGGKSFVQLPMTDLQKSGALVAGGSEPIKAIQGCAGQPLFNGAVRLTLLSAGLKDDRYAVTFRVANGARRDFNPAGDADVNSGTLFAASADGQVQPFNTWDDTASPNRQLTPGANLTATFTTSGPPPFTVTRILYRPTDVTLREGRLDGLPFAPVSAMEFALKCK
ncbi:hypothetical protein [Deinococcus aquiradiocola]|uniref:IPT/TIG domain-containing protein n=1 Tax=Deinococcus aquiradiocola TaxID=393059 RepID=A0A917PR45_9DEIO|nr:hypothetical protein [Deinococcus aquiradiocola]GGJ88198.1 hypothetical protein GCM10008939_35300 [Deinococcus aquiradiocola]